MFNKASRFIFLKIFLIIISIISLTRADYSLGFQWLETRLHEDGSFADSLYPDKLRLSIEVAKTMVLGDSQTHSSFDNLLAYINSEETEFTETIAKRAELNFLLGNESDAVNDLEKLKEIEGSRVLFGLLRNYETDLLDLIHTIKIYRLLNENYLPLLYRLFELQSDDGSWQNKGANVPDPFITSIILEELLQDSLTEDQEQMRDSALSCLLASQNPDGGFGTVFSQIYTSAAAYSVLNATGKHLEKRDAVSYFIKQNQNVNGSWDNGVFETAVALRVLYINLLPDAVALSLNTKKHFYVGDEIQISFGVQNMGETSIETLTVGIGEAAGEIIFLEDFPVTIEPGKDTVLTSNVILPDSITGFFNMQVTLDPNDEIKEISETNNKAIACNIYISVPYTERALSCATVNLFNRYFSPNGDGVKDSLKIRIGTDTVGITVQAWILKERGSNEKLEEIISYQEPGIVSDFYWDGMKKANESYEDGEYELLCIFNQGLDSK
ncbi:MAG: CARDB domain-containing protein, partial [bacterium]